jgi:hypothetical protein
MVTNSDDAGSSSKPRSFNRQHQHQYKKVYRSESQVVVFDVVMKE